MLKREVTLRRPTLSIASIIIIKLKISKTMSLLTEVWTPVQIFLVAFLLKNKFLALDNGSRSCEQEFGIKVAVNIAISPLRLELFMLFEA